MGKASSPIDPSNFNNPSRLVDSKLLGIKNRKNLVTIKTVLHSFCFRIASQNYRDIHIYIEAKISPVDILPNLLPS